MEKAQLPYVLCEPGGTISVLGKDGKSVAVLGIDDAGGRVIVSGEDRKSWAVLGIDGIGGIVSVLGKNGGEVHLATDENGGWIDISNNDKQNVVQIGVTDSDEGKITTKDKFKSKTGSLP